MTSILAFFTGGIGRWLVGAAALMALLLMARMHWIQQGREQILRESAAAVVKIVEKQGKVTERVVTRYIKVAGETKVITNTIEKEVIKYATANLDQCVLSNAFVVLHDSAAVGSIPSAARAIDGSASGVKTSDSLPTVTSNYATCHETAIRLKALQAWISEQAKVTK